MKGISRIEVKVLSNSGIIAQVAQDSIASELGLVPGDKIISVNGQPMKDLIDLSFALSDESVELLVEKVNGEQEILDIEKDYDDDLGIEFESAVFDGVRTCANKCIFCFVDQMAPDMRPSLYVKDDDYRLSFLYGNFVTLTNLTKTDMNRIQRLHLSPLYVSVHTTDSEIRERMLHNKRAGGIMEQLKMLAEFGAEFHTQVVLCPGVNDGKVLEKTIRDLYQLRPNILSLAIVPVGLSRFREKCFPLRVFTEEEAKAIIEMVGEWQKKCRNTDGDSFVYLSDEFYISAGAPIPEYDEYDGFPQLENGIGLVRNFLAEWHNAVVHGYEYDQPIYIDVICGISAEKILRPLLSELRKPNLNIRLVPVVNHFFGENITVTGLLTGTDILNKLKDLNGPRTGIIIPGVALRKGEAVFLDNMQPDDLVKELKIPIRVAHGATELRQLLEAWR